MSDTEREGERRREGEVLLEHPRGRARRLAIAGGLLGFTGFGAWLAILLVRLTGAVDMLAMAMLGAALPLALAISIALPPFILRMRAPRAARLTWDRRGFVEHDGAHVRTAIARADARAKVVEAPRGRLVQITDASGRAISIAEHRATPAWLSRRRASTVDLAALEGTLVDLEGGPEIAPDARDARRPTMSALVAIVTAIGGVIVAPLLFAVDASIAAAFVALIACILCALPALRPLHELFALLAEARRFASTEEATIEEGDDREALLRREDRTLVRVDVARAASPDAFLATREGTKVHVTLPPAGWIAAPSRASVGPAISIDAIETEHERNVRAELLRALTIELVVRGAAILFWFGLSISPVFLG